MKKVFLALLCAGLFVACGNKKTAEPEAVVDTVATEVVEEAPVVEEPVAEEPAQETKAAPAKKTTTTKKPAQKTESTAPESTKKHLESAAERVANAAIDRGEKEATNQIQTQRRR